MKACPEERGRRGTRGWRRPWRILVAVAVTLGAAEACVRLFWSEPRATVMSADLRTLWRLPRGRTIVWNGARCSINSQGYRGEEFAPEKPPGLVRVYLSGDSSVFGDGVAFETTLGEVLSRRLKSLRPGPGTIEVINGGVPGFSTVQSIARMEESGWATRPDILVIANLWSDAARADFPDSLRLERNLHSPWLRTQLALDRTLNGLATYRFGKCMLLAPRQIGRVDSQGVPVGLPRRVPPDDYARNLRHLVAGARERGAIPVLLLLPHVTDQLALGGEEIRAMRSDLRAQGKVEMEQDYRDVMRAVARDTETPLIDCVPRVADVPVLLFLDDVHPNERGHELIGGELADRIGRMPVFQGAP